MSEPTRPPEYHQIHGNVSSTSATSRQPYNFRLRAHASDNGLILSDPADYYVNMSLDSVITLMDWMGAWVRFQRARFRPTGFALVNLINGERRERAEGQAIVLIGDSFYIRNESGEDISGPLPITDWDFAPIHAAT